VIHLSLLIPSSANLTLHEIICLPKMGNNKCATPKIYTIYRYIAHSCKACNLRMKGPSDWLELSANLSVYVAYFNSALQTRQTPILFFNTPVAFDFLLSGYLYIRYDKIYG